NLGEARAPEIVPHGPDGTGRVAQRLVHLALPLPDLRRGSDEAVAGQSPSAHPLDPAIELPGLQAAALFSHAVRVAEQATGPEDAPDVGPEARAARRIEIVKREAGHDGVEGARQRRGEALVEVVLQHPQPRRAAQAVAGARQHLFRDIDDGEADLGPADEDLRAHVAVAAAEIE